MKCKHCKQETDPIIVKHLKSGRKLYRCRLCWKEFNEFTGTKLKKSRLPSEKILELYELLGNHTEAKAIAQILDIHLSTVYRWKKKLTTEEIHIET